MADQRAPSGLPGSTGPDPFTTPAGRAADRIPSTRIFLLYRDNTGTRQVVGLDTAARVVTVGRGPGNDVILAWDGKVSRVHAWLERFGSNWTLADDGLSRNGTFVNGERLLGRRRLDGGDVILVGSTLLTYADNRAGDHAGDHARGSTVTLGGEGIAIVQSLSPTQLSVLQALCRPYRDRSQYSAPATNRQIADELFFGVDSVKAHMRALFHKFGVADLPQNQKRARLVELAFQAGLIVDRDR
jgi:pSer/pThr/pTyr-binding forkhead associated (FHA) protein/DNA-binding CsgD family transcriptional regulator